MDKNLCMDLLIWFIEEPSHKGYTDITPLDECPNPVSLLQEDDMKIL